MVTYYKGKIGVEDFEIGDGTFLRRDQDREWKEYTQIQIDLSKSFDELFAEASAATFQTLFDATIEATDIIPDTDDAYDIGDAAHAYQKIFCKDIDIGDDAVIADDLYVGGTCTVVGNVIFSLGNLTVTTGNLTVTAGDLTVGGDAAITGDLAVTGSIDNILPTNYLTGLELSNAADTDHDITVATGRCRDTVLDTYDIILAAAITKKLDGGAWAEGTNQNGLLDGAIAVDTWYNVFLMLKDDDTVDMGFYTGTDPSPTGDNKLPTDYIACRRIGAVKTKAAATEILNFIQQYDHFWYVSPILDHDNTEGDTAVQRVLPVPPDVVVIINVAVESGAERDVYIKHPDVTDITPSDDVTPLYTEKSYLSIDGGGVSVHAVGSSSDVEVRASDANTEVSIVVLGYIDTRGK